MKKYFVLFSFALSVLWLVTRSYKNEEESAVVQRFDKGLIKEFCENPYWGMKLIPAKDCVFRMGTLAMSPFNTVPSQNVKLTYDFYMDSTEVTQKVYENIMRYTYPKYSHPIWDSTIRTIKGDQYPANYISWYDAVLFCNARSKLVGLDTVYDYDSIKWHLQEEVTLYNVKININVNGYRLPSEAEWEYAARAGTKTDFYWGKNFYCNLKNGNNFNECMKNYPCTKEDTIELEKYVVWRSLNTEYVLGDGLQEIASKLPNSFGLYDMSGSLEEWCNDWENDYYWRIDTVIDPVNLTESTGRIQRGGSWFCNYSKILSSGFRTASHPQHKSSRTGFRTVKKK